MPHLAHALDRSTVCRTRNSRELNPEPKELDALSTVLDPLFAGVEVVLNAAHEVFGDAGQFHRGDLVHQIVEPPIGALGPRLLERTTVELQGDGAIIVLDRQQVALVIELVLIATLVRHFDDHAIFDRISIIDRGGLADVGDKRHGSDP